MLQLTKKSLLIIMQKIEVTQKFAQTAQLIKKNSSPQAPKTRIFTSKSSFTPKSI